MASIPSTSALALNTSYGLNKIYLEVINLNKNKKKSKTCNINNSQQRLLSTTHSHSMHSLGGAGAEVIHGVPFSMCTGAWKRRPLQISSRP